MKFRLTITSHKVTSAAQTHKQVDLTSTGRPTAVALTSEKLLFFLQTLIFFPQSKALHLKKKSLKSADVYT